MGTSIDRLAMDLQGRTHGQAAKTLDRHGFSLAEASEIICSFRVNDDNHMTGSWLDLAKVIESTMRTSMRIGDRIDMNI